MFFEQRQGLFSVVAHVGVGREVDVTLLLDPGQRLPGRALEQAELLVLVKPLLLGGPVLQHTVLLSQKLLKNDWKKNKDSVNWEWDKRLTVDKISVE